MMIKTNLIYKKLGMWLFLTVLLWCVALIEVHAQQEPQYTQYMFNMMSVNPAYAGTRDGLNALFLSRIQWVGVDGAPRSNTFALHTPVKDKKIGLGVSVITDRIGPVNNTYLNLNYAHRLNISEKHTLSLGLKGGILNYHAGLADVDLNEFDESFASDLRKNLQPNLGVGAYFYSKDYYAGISVPKLIKTDLETGSTSNTIGELKRHFFITAGYVYAVNSMWKLKPSFINKMVEGAPMSLDITAQALYRERFWLGTTYRIGDAISLLFDVQANRQLKIGYSYDITTSQMSKVTNGTHEILISYNFAGFAVNKVKSPRYF